MHPTLRWLSIAMVGPLLGACGDAAPDEGYAGEPLDVIDCTVSGLLPTDTVIRLALAWQRPEDGMLVAGSDTSVVEAFPAQATIRIFQPPDPGYEQGRADVEGTLALGFIVAFADEDGDGRWTMGVDTMVGGGVAMAVVYTAAGAYGVPVGDLAPGFHHVQTNGCTYPKESPRFAGPITDPTVAVVIGSKFVFEAFPLTCPPPAPVPVCAGLEAIRWTCRETPDDPICATCDGGIIPIAGSQSECEAWLAGCVGDPRFYPDECNGEYKQCTSSDQSTRPEPCDRVCVCDKNYADCLEAWPDDPQVCDIKKADCLD